VAEAAAVNSVEAAAVAAGMEVVADEVAAVAVAAADRNQFILGTFGRTP